MEKSEEETTSGHASIVKEGNRISTNEKAKFYMYRDVFNYLKTSSYPLNYGKDEKRKLRAKSKRFYISQGGKLMIRSSRSVGSALHSSHLEGQYGKEVAMDSVEAQKIIHEFHDQRGHLGRDRTYYGISETYFWDGLYGDVEFYVRSCPKCQMVNSCNFDKGMSELYPIAIKSPWYHVGMDLVLLPETKTGNKYLFTLCDYFTKWPEAVPIPDKSAGTVSLALYKICLRMGFPCVYSSDQGREFVNQIMDELKNITQSKQRLSTAYHPQTNGLVERFNQTIQKMLLKCCSENQDDWDDYVDECLYGYRTTIHSSTKVSPFEAMYGRKPIGISKSNLPENVVVMNELEEANEDQTVCLEDLTSYRKRLYEAIRENVKTSQSKQKEQYEAKRLKQGGIAFQEGDKVLLFNSRKASRKGSKLEKTWTGPYTVAESMGKNVYRLKSSSGKILKTKYNGSKLKKFVERSETASSHPATSEDALNNSTMETGKKQMEEKNMSFGDEMQENPRRFMFPPKQVIEKIASNLHVEMQTYIYEGETESFSAPLGPPKNIEKIIGDGNCFYRSISKILTGNESQHLLIRTELVKHMESDLFKKRFEDYLNVNSISSYIGRNKVGQDGTWATDVEIIATSSLLQMDIEVYSFEASKQNYVWLRYPASFSLNKPTPYAIYIMNKDGVHFDVVSSINT